MENLENNKITTQNQGCFDDVFGILTATTGASVEVKSLNGAKFKGEHIFALKVQEIIL